ncbi:MAG: hypothetical protein LBU19_03170 [Treponema sp.]|jgi:hypothetical protein|nr:hypothetical protein [Treponema sp.]
MHAKDTVTGGGGNAAQDGIFAVLRTPGTCFGLCSGRSFERGSHDND